MIKVLLISIFSFVLLASCHQQKKKRTINPVTPQGGVMGIVPNERLFEMRISPDTFHTSVEMIAAKIINHSSDTARFGKRYELKCYNPSTDLWEETLPSNLVNTSDIHYILPHSECAYKVPLRGNETPGKYRFIIDLYTPHEKNIVIGEFVMSADERYKR